MAKAVDFYDGMIDIQQEKTPKQLLQKGIIMHGFSIISLFAFVLILSGCSFQKTVQSAPEPGKVEQLRQERAKDEALQHFIDGSVFETKGEYAKAIIEYQDALRFDKDPAIYYAVAKNYAMLNKLALAAEMGREAARLDSTNITYRQSLAEIYTKAFQYDLALAEFNKVLILDSNNISSMFNIARLTQSTQPLRALEMYDKLIQRSGPEWETLFQMAELNIALRRYDRAAVAFEQMLKIDPANLALRKSLGEMYVRAEKYDKAVPVFTDLLERDSTNLEIRGALAGTYLQRGDWNLARRQFDTILQSDSLSPDARFRIAITYFIQLQKDSTLLGSTTEQFEKFLKEFPGDSRTNGMELRGALAELYLEQGNWNKAREQFEVIAKGDTLPADIHFRIAFAYFMQTRKDSGLVAEARMQFERFSQLHPKDWRGYFYCGILRLVARETDSARSYFEKVIALEKKNADAWWYLGSLCFDQKRYEEMVELMEKAIEIVPKDARLHFLRGLGLTRLNQNDDAIHSLEKSAELDPKDINTLSTLGMTYDAMKRFKESDSTYEHALRLDPHYPLVLNNYAYSLSERGLQLERAYHMSRESLEKDTANGSYLDTFGWILYRLGRYAEALPYIQRAITGGEVNPVVYEHLGDVLSKLDRTDEAKSFWRKALELDPANEALRKKLDRGTL
ncbi:MAG: tetratricopeptide repeat protein [Ignavibacteriales bacterium]|nr:tetratricopeptide repeat protein [Ignavibacteriales bacterium]